MFDSKSGISTKNSVQEALSSIIQTIPSRLTHRLIKLRQQKLNLLGQLSSAKEANNNAKKSFLKVLKQKQQGNEQKYVPQYELRKTIEKFYRLKAEKWALQRQNKKINLNSNKLAQEEKQEMIQKILDKKKSSAKLEQQLNLLEEKKILNLPQQRSLLKDIQQQKGEKIVCSEKVSEMKRLKRQNEQLQATLGLIEGNIGDSLNNQNLLSYIQEEENEKMLLLQELSQFKEEFEKVKQENQRLRGLLS